MLRTKRLPRLSRATWVWLYVLSLAALAAAVYVAFVAGTEPLQRPHLEWWLIALAFVVAEACVVHLEFRHSAHSFSLADIPFVFGLIFASGESLALGAVAGSAVVYACRRLAPVKIAFNCARLGLVVSVVVIVTRAIAPESGSGLGTWLGVLAGTMASGALTMVCIAGPSRSPREGCASARCGRCSRWMPWSR
jgi:hypothetical protein